MAEPKMDNRPHVCAHRNREKNRDPETDKKADKLTDIKNTDIKCTNGQTD